MKRNKGGGKNEMKNHFVDPNTDVLSVRADYQMTYLICSKSGGRIGCVRKAYKRMLNRLGVENASLHTLRHTFASMCVMNNVDLYTIKEFLGHSRVTTTEIYTHVSQEYKLNSIEKITSDIIEFDEPINEIQSDNIDLDNIQQSNIRMVNLFLDTETEPKFREMCEALQNSWGTENITATTYEAVKISYENIQS